MGSFYDGLSSLLVPDKEKETLHEFAQSKVREMDKQSERIDVEIDALRRREVIELKRELAVAKEEGAADSVIQALNELIELQVSKSKSRRAA